MSGQTKNAEMREWIAEMRVINRLARRAGVESIEMTPDALDRLVDYVEAYLDVTVGKD